MARFHAAILERAAQPEATIFRGSRPRTDRMSAAMANAVAACWLEIDEGYRPVPCHAGLHVLPALLAEAEATDRPVRDVLAALALGYEIVTRIARCWNAPALVVHTHAQYCAVGAAMGVALLRRLDPASLLNVLAMASTFVNAGPRNHALSGALVRNAWPAAGAWNGMLSVNLHECGFGGNADAPCDVYAAILGCDMRPQELADRLGERWAVFDGYTKAYACCQHTHSAAEAALALHASLPAGGEMSRRSGNPRIGDAVAEPASRNDPGRVVLFAACGRSRAAARQRGHQRLRCRDPARSRDCVVAKSHRNGPADAGAAPAT